MFRIERKIADYLTGELIQQNKMLHILFIRSNLKINDWHKKASNFTGRTLGSRTKLSDIFAGRRHLPIKDIVPYISTLGLKKEENDYYICEFFKVNSNEYFHQYISTNNQSDTIVKLEDTINYLNETICLFKQNFFYEKEHSKLKSNELKRNNINYKKSKTEQIYQEIEYYDEGYDEGYYEVITMSNLMENTNSSWIKAIFEIDKIYKTKNKKNIKKILCFMPHKLNNLLDEQFYNFNKNKCYEAWKDSLDIITPRNKKYTLLGLFNLWVSDNKNEFNETIGFLKNLNLAKNNPNALYEYRNYRIKHKKNSFYENINFLINSFKKHLPYLWSLLGWDFFKQDSFDIIEDEFTIFKLYISYTQRFSNDFNSFIKYHESIDKPENINTLNITELRCLAVSFLNFKTKEHDKKIKTSLDLEMSLIKLEISSLHFYDDTSLPFDIDNYLKQKPYKYLYSRVDKSYSLNKIISVCRESINDINDKCNIINNIKKSQTIKPEHLKTPSEEPLFLLTGIKSIDNLLYK